MNLLDAKPGKYLVDQLICGTKSTKRLVVLGILPNTEIEKINQDRFVPGPVKLRVKGSNLAIGRGLAQRIIVEEI